METRMAQQLQQIKMMMTSMNSKYPKNLVDQIRKEVDTTKNCTVIYIVEKMMVPIN
jgi:ribosomal protein S25